MKIALISDIHANLPALEAVLEDLDKQNPDLIFCLGDLVGYNIWPNEVIQEIRRRKIPTIAGNYDYGIGLSSNDCGCAYKTEDEKRMGAVSISFTNKIIGSRERDYLKQLPLHIGLDLPGSNEKLKLLLVHGSPRKINEYLFEDRDEKSFVRIFEQSTCDIMCFGHTHKPFKKIFPGNKGDNFLAINTGSVGKPKDGDSRANYVMLEYSDLIGGVNPIKVDFIKVNYDVERAANAVEESELPDEYAEMLRIGR